MIPNWWETPPTVAADIGMHCSEQCGEPAHGLIGTRAYCYRCGADLLDQIDQRVIHDESAHALGHGTPKLVRPDVGIGWWELECPICATEWLGRAGEYCGRCATRHNEIARTHQTPTHNSKAVRHAS